MLWLEMETRSISPAKLTAYRETTFRYANGYQLKSAEHAVDYVNERGYISFWPISGNPFPSLWGAVAGARSVADEHDDPGHITWQWKDSLLDQRVWYYARILKKKNTLVSLETIPYFYALSPNFGDPEADLLDQYNRGEVTQETKLVFEALLRKGPLDTISLRKEAHLSRQESTSAFNSALTTLQSQLRVLPVAISEAGAWKYAFVYDLTHRYYPDLLEKARNISETQAVDSLVLLCLRSLGAATHKEIASLLSLSNFMLTNSLDRLSKSGAVIGDVRLDESKSIYFLIPELI